MDRYLSLWQNCALRSLADIGKYQQRNYPFDVVNQENGIALFSSLLLPTTFRGHSKVSKVHWHGHICATLLLFARVSQVGKICCKIVSKALGRHFKTGLPLALGGFQGFGSENSSEFVFMSYLSVPITTEWVPLRSHYFCSSRQSICVHGEKSIWCQSGGLYSRNQSAQGSVIT